MFLFIFQSDSILSPATIAIITAVFTVIVGAVGTAALWAKAHSNSRIKGLIGALITAYGLVAPFISTFPRGIGVALSAFGLVLTLTSARIQGPDMP